MSKKKSVFMSRDSWDFKDYFVFMSKKNLSLCLWILCVFMSRDSGILRIILSLCLRKSSVFMSKKIICLYV